MNVLPKSPTRPIREQLDRPTGWRDECSINQPSHRPHAMLAIVAPKPGEPPIS
jgi:hypothetical protein